MIRTLISIPENMVSMLDTMAKKHNSSRTALIRIAIKDWLKAQTKPKIKAFGILKGPDSLDGVELQRRLRNEW